MYYLKYQILLIIFGFLTILAFSHMFNKTMNTEHITYTWLLLVSSAQILLIIYGLINGIYGIYLPSLILVSEILYIMYIKVYGFNDKDLNIITELKTKNILV